VLLRPVVGERHHASILFVAQPLIVHDDRVFASPTTPPFAGLKDHQGTQGAAVSLGSVYPGQVANGRAAVCRDGWFANVGQASALAMSVCAKSSPMNRSGLSVVAASA
jgi:hypothetical protein